MIGTHIHLVKIAQSIEEVDSANDDISIWFAYKKTSDGKWKLDYNDLTLANDEIGWSVCETVLDFHNNQAWL
jgi:hypothetical protein